LPQASSGESARQTEMSAHLPLPVLAYAGDLPSGRVFGVIWLNS
jgi:hypothetical protein